MPILSTHSKLVKSLNADSALVTSVISGYAHDYDGYKLKSLVQKDEGKRIEAGTVVGDKG